MSDKNPSSAPTVSVSGARGAKLSMHVSEEALQRLDALADLLSQRPEHFSRRGQRVTRQDALREVFTAGIFKLEAEERAVGRLGGGVAAAAANTAASAGASAAVAASPQSAAARQAPAAPAAPETVAAKRARFARTGASWAEMYESLGAMLPNSQQVRELAEILAPYYMDNSATSAPRCEFDALEWCAQGIASRWSEAPIGGDVARGRANAAADRAGTDRAALVAFRAEEMQKNWAQYVQMKRAGAPADALLRHLRAGWEHYWMVVEHS